MRPSTLRRVSRIALTGACLFFGSTESRAQSLDGTGAVAVGLRLRQLDGVKRVLMIAAHPDDEDTSLLATLARGWGAETAYLSLTRGDGGQNAIGPELWEGLGVVRTGELEAARRLDGAEQFFTRAFDYGFSKSAEEAFSLWPREELLADVVWVIRSYRPHVIVSVWSGTPRDGHGQHQASGIIAHEAYEAAGDPTRFPEQLAMGVEAWAPAKLYESSRGIGGRGGPPAAGVMQVQTGQLDPLLGRSLQQLSAASRSQHRSQEMGSAEVAGPRATGVLLLESRVGNAEGFFAGIDTTLVGLTSGLPANVAAATRTELDGYRTAIARARDEMGLDASVVVDDLAEAIARLQGALVSAGSGAPTELLMALSRRWAQAQAAFVAAAGVRFDVRAEDDLLVPGQTVRVRASVWNGGSLVLARPRVELPVPDGWRATLASTEGLSTDGSVAPGAFVTWTYDVAVPTDAESSRLYYMQQERDAARYRWPEDPSLWARPRDPALVSGTLVFEAVSSGRSLVSMVGTVAPWRNVTVEPTRGEVSRPVLVVPAVSVRVTPQGLVWPQSRSASRSISVVVRTEAEGGSRGDLYVRAPAGWSVTPATLPYALDEAGAERTLSFEVRPTGSVATGEHVFAVTARDASGRAYDEGYTLVDYEHIDRAALYRPAEARISVIPVVVAEGLRVGYVMGSGDDGPEAIRQLGADVELLDEDRVRNGDFGDFDVIVLGVRAVEARADVRAAADQLLDFAREGGTVIAQYNRESLGGLPPVPLEVGRASPRVADERAPVRVLAPEAPVLTTPNRIGAADFDGWVQERGLYFAEAWDDAYWPLLEMNDPGEPPQRGSLLVASVGEGVFVYTALSFFRQWADGVSGPYRLFANLISLDPAAWRAFSARP
ncbi:MAG: PIG-L family deacetylase [Longimicrobiales bacterium]